MAACPHCQNALPDDATGLCPNCGGDVAQPPPPSVPSRSDAPPPLPSHGIPWDDRDRLGLASALIETTKLLLTQPVAFFQAMPTSGGIGSPLLYAVIIGWIGFAVAAFYQALLNSVAGSGMAAFGESPELAQALNFVQGWGWFFVQLILGGVIVAVTVFIVSGILHLMLLILGGARRDFETTFRVVSFAEAPAIMALIPFCGGFVALVWGIVLAIIGVTHTHEISGGKAAAAVLLPILLFCCCCVGLFMLAVGSIGALATAAQ
jgi:hypothetical protein